MKYKGILVDIDNTLYGYGSPHFKALDKIYQVCLEQFNISKEKTKIAFETARKKIHIELSETAASHNRLLYIQKMLELLKINPLSYSILIYNAYWDTFLNNIEIYEGVNDLFEKYRGKICLVTDLTAHIQYRKINKLKLEKYIDCVVTSEEAGKEKPHPYLFMLALKKINLKPEEVCMIGDSFKKDIVGATNLGIKSFWINHEHTIETIDKSLVTELKSFKETLEYV